ncbi:hypothetical protein IKG54_01365, partial [Candidatus Saccharibacteria bacterium]|nr:hypothetical protein [Candidatus Saccharibacteria bacterium]
TIQGVSPNSLTLDQAAQDITIVTTTPATELGLGDVTAKITNSSLGVDLSLTNCSETIVEISGTNYRAARCAYPGGTVEQGGLPVGTYNIELTSTWHSATYTKANAITVTSNYSITIVTPDVGNNNATTTITMATNAEAANSTAFGTVIGTIGSTAMTDCSETTSGDYRAVQCTIPSGVTAGTYAVSFTAAGHSNTNYTKASAVTIRAYLTVSGGSGSGWYAPNTTVNIAANTCGTNMEFWQWTTTGGTIVSSTSPSTTITTTTSNITVTRNCSMTCASIASGGVGIVNGYNVKKLADGKCWQTSTYTYATWEDRGSCPNGFAFPSKSNFELLVSKYSGGGLYADWGLSATTYLWSSTEYDNTTAYRLLINSNAADILSSNKTNRFAVRCYAQ